MENEFRAHHIICTSLYEGKGYSGAFCENMTRIETALRKEPVRRLVLVAEPDMICANCPNQTSQGTCSHNANQVVGKDRRVMERFDLKEKEQYSYRELCRHALEHMNHEVFMEFCGKCDWRAQGLCNYDDLLAQLSRCVNQEKPSSG